MIPDQLYACDWMVGKKLTAVILPSRRFVSVDAKMAYESVKDKSVKDASE